MEVERFFFFFLLVAKLEGVEMMKLIASSVLGLAVSWADFTPHGLAVLISGIEETLPDSSEGKGRSYICESTGESLTAWRSALTAG